jgi:dihydrofolate reductase
MRDLIVVENSTVDGVIELLGDWFDPTAESADIQELVRTHMVESDALLLGRITYNDFKGFWPLQQDDQTGNTAYLNQTEKYVVSSTMQESDWENTTILAGPVEEEIQRIKALPGKAITVTGSITLVRALIAAGLVDEYRLFVYPVISGVGRRLIEPGDTPPGLHPISVQTFQNGVVLLTYRATNGTASA